MAVGPSHDVWFCDTIGHSIDSISPHGDVTAYPGLPGHEPAMGIVGGPDGNIWYGARGGGVVRMTPSGSSTFFSIAMGIRIIAMTVGSDENIWAIGYNLSGACGCLVKITTSGRITIYPPQNGSDQLLSIATGSDGNVWYVAADLNGSTIERATPGGVFASFKTSARAYRIAAAKDGDMYASLPGSGPNADGGVLLRITPAGRINQIPGTADMIDGMSDVTEGPDGNIWGNAYCSTAAQCLVKFDVASRRYSETKIPCAPAYVDSMLIETGSDRNVWLQPAHGTCSSDAILEYVTGL